MTDLSQVPAGQLAAELARRKRARRDPETGRQLQPIRRRDARRPARAYEAERIECGRCVRVTWSDADEPRTADCVWCWRQEVDLNASEPICYWCRARRARREPRWPRPSRAQDEEPSEDCAQWATACAPESET